MINEWGGELNRAVNKDKARLLGCPQTKTSCIHKETTESDKQKISLIDSSWRLYLTPHYDSLSALLTLWHVKMPGSFEAKTHICWGERRRKKCTFLCHRKKNRGGPNNLNNTLQFSFVEHAKIDIFKELFRDVKQSRWSTNTSGPGEVAWQPLSFSSNGYILDRRLSDKKIVTAFKFKASYTRFFPFKWANERSQLPTANYYRYLISYINVYGFWVKNPAIKLINTI